MKYIIGILITMLTFSMVAAKDLAPVLNVDKLKVVKKDLIPKNGISFQANQTSPDKSWRLIHNKKEVVALFESTGYTQSLNEVKVFTTEEEALARVKVLGLKEIPVEFIKEVNK